MDRKTNILVECNSLIPSVQVGVLNSLKPLQEMGKCRFYYKKSIKINKEDLHWCDVMICVRGSEQITYDIVIEAKRLGKFLVYYLDDDLLDIPEDISSTDYYSKKSVKSNIKKIMQICDVLWVVNDQLGKKYASFFHGQYVLANVPAVIVKNANLLRQPIQILYAGSIDHSEIVSKYLSPAVEKLCEDYGDDIFFVFIGVDPKLDHLNQVSFKPFIDHYEKYREDVEKYSFHIGLAPIYTTEFYQNKYFNKFVEYTTIGAVGIYTDSMPYNWIIKHGINGYLCNNSVEEWYQVIKHAVEDHAERKLCFENAKALIEQSFDPISIANQLEVEIPQLTKYNAPYVVIKDIHFSARNFVYNFQRFKNAWRDNGFGIISMMITKIINFITTGFRRP